MVYPPFGENNDWYFSVCFEFSTKLSFIFLPIFVLSMTMQPIINEQFSNPIWRMEIDELTDRMVLELRSEEKKVSFASVNLQNGEVYFKALATSEQWLTGIETVYDGVLLLHYYQSETGPVHKGLMAIDAVTSKTLWSNYNLAFDYLSVNGPVVFDTMVQPRKLFLADIKTGATKRLYEPSVYKRLTNNIIVPEHITAAELPEKLFQAHPFGNMVHYLEYNNLRIVSLHALKAGELTQSIFIFDGVDKIYEDLLNSNIQKIQPEAFILHNNRLIYIKNRSVLKVLAL